MSQARAAGDKFEREFACLAEEHQLHAERSHKNAPFDFVVNGLKVQCKYRTIGADGRVQLCFGRRNNGAEKNGYVASEFDVLALKCGESVYIIPTQALLCKDGQRIKNKLRITTLKNFADNWGAFGAGQPAPIQRQALLAFAD